MSILGELMPVYTLKPGTKPPDEVNVVVEILKKETGFGFLTLHTYK